MFYAVGVGPGDPMWMTREACAVLEACPVIAAPQTASGEMLALSIAQGAAELGGKTVLPLSFAMSRDAAVRAEGYARAADAIAPELDAGRDVAMVNLGDVSIYATAYYVLDELRRRGYDTRMVPGVASFSASEARKASCASGEVSCPLISLSIPKIFCRNAAISVTLRSNTVGWSMAT